MDTRTGWWTSALVLLVTIGWAPQARADDEPGEPARLEIKHVDDEDRVQVEIPAEADSAVKLVPFPEDLEEQSAPPKTIKAAPVDKPSVRLQPSPRKTVERLPATSVPKSNFQPRFKMPVVRQAQHLEPTEAAKPATIAADTDAATPASKSEDTQVASPSVPSATGKSLVEEAFAKSKAAASDSDYTEIIDLCRRAGKEGLKKNHEDYAKNLMSWAYNRRGESRANEARDKEALADFEAAVELNRASWRAVHNRGVSYAALGRTQQAVADFDRAIKLNPKYPNAYFNRGELLYSQDRFEDAIRDYTAALALGPADAVMHNSRGHAFYRLKRFGEAMREYGDALQLEPNNAAALVNRGDVYSDLGRYADAANDYRAAITADPKLARAYQAAAWLMATCADEHYRNDKLAIEAATKAVELDGDDHRNLETLAAAQASAGRFAEAKATQEKAIAKVPQTELVAAEKRMALYQRDLAFREQSRQEMMSVKEDQLLAEGTKKFPVRRATADVPDGPQSVTYPETQTEQPPRSYAPRSFWPPKAAGGQPRSKGRPRMAPKTPTHPLGRN